MGSGWDIAAVIAVGSNGVVVHMLGLLEPLVVMGCALLEVMGCAWPMVHYVTLTQPAHV
jgi:hypothetical protein